MGELRAGGERIRNQGEAPPVRSLTADHDRSGTASADRPRSSVRQGRRPGPIAVLAGLTALAIVLFGLRLLSPAYASGDLVYHGALALGLLRGGLPLEGAYAGLPAYYPPGYHLALAAPMAAFGMAPVDAAGLVFLVVLPLLPIGTYLLTTRLTGRPWVAVLAVALTLFGGAYNLNPLRQWVNSLFMGGHATWTSYPRDLVFTILPFAAWAFLRSLEAGGGWGRIGWSLGAGLLLGIAALIQVQVLLPIPFAFALVAVVVAARNPRHRVRALAALVACGLLALAITTPWLLGTIDDIRRHGGVALDSSDMLEPARFGPWSYPREFGLMLPLAFAGAGTVLLFLRRATGPAPGGEPGPWRPALREGGVLVVAWWIVPFVLGVLYDPGWPLEDALRPQRLWLIASQPLAILAAIGLVMLVEHLLHARRRLATGAVVAAVLVISVPATWATASIVARSMTRDAYAMLDRGLDRVPHFEALLGRTGPRATVVAPEDWSALVWFDTGLQVVGIVPPGYAKLAFDPATSTVASQPARRAAQVQAWSGDLGALAQVADRFAADRIVIPRDGDRWELVSIAAAGLATTDPGSTSGEVIEGNGWDAVVLGAAGRVVLPPGPGGPQRVTARAARPASADEPTPRLVVLAVPADGRGVGRELATMELLPGGDAWARGSVDVVLEPGERLAVEATGPITLQAVGAWLPRPAIPAGWHVAAETDEATVLERGP